MKPTLTTLLLILAASIGVAFIAYNTGKETGLDSVRIRYTFGKDTAYITRNIGFETLHIADHKLKATNKYITCTPIVDTLKIEFLK